MTIMMMTVIAVTKCFSLTLAHQQDHLIVLLLQYMWATHKKKQQKKQDLMEKQ